MGAYKQNPRYNQVQTRLTDEDYDSVRNFAKIHKVSHAKAAEVLIVAALKLMGVK